MIQEAKDFLKSREKLNLGIVIINILVFAIFCLLGSTRDNRFMIDHGAMFVPLIVEKGEYYRLFTSMFIHFSIEHLFSNMLLLIFAGDMLEKVVGKIRYLIIYLGGGLAGNLLSLYVDQRASDLRISAGASGAIFAVMGALVWLAILNRKRLGRAYVKRLIFVTLLTLANGYSQPNVDNSAHLGGFLGGLLLALLLTGLQGYFKK